MPHEESIRTLSVNAVAGQRVWEAKAATTTDDLSPLVEATTLAFSLFRNFCRHVLGKGREEIPGLSFYNAKIVIQFSDP